MRNLHLYVTGKMPTDVTFPHLTSGDPAYIRDLNGAITGHDDAIAPNGAKAPVGTVITK